MKQTVKILLSVAYSTKPVSCGTFSVMAGLYLTVKLCYRTTVFLNNLQNFVCM